MSIVGCCFLARLLWQLEGRILYNSFFLVSWLFLFYISIELSPKASSSTSPSFNLPVAKLLGESKDLSIWGNWGGYRLTNAISLLQSQYVEIHLSAKLISLIFRNLLERQLSKRNFVFECKLLVINSLSILFLLLGTQVLDTCGFRSYGFSF